MIDIYFVTAIINMFWQIFTILFVLYRFTSFFSMVINFVKFLGKLLQGIVYVKNHIRTYITGYTMVTSQNDTSHKTTFQKCYEWIFGNTTPKTEELPLFETRMSYTNEQGKNNESTEFSKPLTYLTQYSQASSHSSSEEPHLHIKYNNPKLFGITDSNTLLNSDFVSNTLKNNNETSDFWNSPL